MRLPLPIKRRRLLRYLHLKKNALQATLLDLMDRGVIVYEQQGNEVVLTRKSHGHGMILNALYEYGFGDQVSCTVKDLFKNYEFSDDVYKHAKKSRSRCYSFARK